MRLSYDLTLEQSQKLIMTAELRQAIELLQFNSMELKEYISNELESNPMLEVSKESSDEFDNLDKYSNEGDIDWKEYLEKYDDISYRPEVDRNIKEFNYEAFTSYEPTLKEHLLSQLSLVSLNSIEQKIGLNIIQNIDENGYLKATVDEIANSTKASVRDVEEVLDIIQTFEPNGVGARNLKECLLLQAINEKGIKPYVFQIIEDYLEDIGRNKIQKISKELGLELTEVQQACDYIKRLEPKPGRAFRGNIDTRYIVPDAEIKIIDGEFVVIMKESAGPSLNINKYYRELMKSGGDKNTVDFLNDKFNSATWIIRSIEQRRNTIKKTIEAIIKFQRDFFIEGQKALKPLTLKDIANEVNMHESTISRATNGKYVQTPRGLFELKYFFSTGLLGEEGEDISSMSIKVSLKEVIEQEDSKKPYSDQKICEILEKKGINISRRTVAKYRDELNIPSSSMRKRY